jgi:hypothetical protein
VQTQWITRTNDGMYAVGCKFIEQVAATQAALTLAVKLCSTQLLLFATATRAMMRRSDSVGALAILPV